MQKAPVMKGSGLKPLDETKQNEEVHVFGKNLEERVVTKDENEESPTISFNSIQPDNNQSEDDTDSIRKRKFDAITGEEDEDTIFQGDFKLFIWDLTTSNWIEKGRGQLKLNDSIGKDDRKSRLIMRVSGTLRIVLNVSISRPFFRILANSKTNLRFTDSQTVWAASGSNAQQLKDLIEERLKVEDEESEPNKKAKSEEEDSSAPLKKTKADDTSVTGQKSPEPSSSPSNEKTDETTSESKPKEGEKEQSEEEKPSPVEESPKDSDESKT